MTGEVGALARPMELRSAMGSLSRFERLAVAHGADNEILLTCSAACLATLVVAL